MRETPEDPAATELDNLPDDADEATRGKRFADKAIDDAILDLYNPAQLDVLRRAGQIVRGSNP